jgi:hypothetical protein
MRSRAELVDTHARMKGSQGSHRRVRRALTNEPVALGAVDDRGLAQLLSAIQPQGRDVLRRAMRAEQFERDELAARLLDEQSESARDLADLVDLASIHPEIRQHLARVLGELEALD